MGNQHKITIGHTRPILVVVRHCGKMLTMERELKRLLEENNEVIVISSIAPDGSYYKNGILIENVNTTKLTRDENGTVTSISVTTGMIPEPKINELFEIKDTSAELNISLAEEEKAHDVKPYYHRFRKSKY